MIVWHLRSRCVKNTTFCWPWALRSINLSRFWQFLPSFVFVWHGLFYGTHGGNNASTTVQLWRFTPNFLNPKKTPPGMKIPTHMPHVWSYLPTKLGDFVRANVGIHIPAPWFAYGQQFLTIEAKQRILALPNFCGLGCAGGGTLSDLGAPWAGWGFSRAPQIPWSDICLVVWNIFSWLIYG